MTLIFSCKIKTSFLQIENFLLLKAFTFVVKNENKLTKLQTKCTAYTHYTTSH